MLTESRGMTPKRRDGAADRFARRLGIQTLHVRPGRARLRLRVAPSMVNVHGVPAVALAMSIQFLDAAQAGEMLVAEAREQRLGRRAAFYAMTVTGRGGRPIATCQGVMHRRSVSSEHLGVRP